MFVDDLTMLQPVGALGIVSYHGWLLSFRVSSSQSLDIATK